MPALNAGRKPRARAGIRNPQKKLTRARLLSFFAKLEPCLVGIEASGASHHWARELTRLGIRHG